MLSDLKFAFRQLLKSPGFTFVALLTLALGIGLNTSMFSLMNQLILQPLPYPDKDQLVRIYRTTPQTQTADHSVQEVQELERGAKDFASLATLRQWGFNLAQTGHPAVNLAGLRVSSSFFPVLGVQPELGRVFTPEEDQLGNHVAILSHATWQAQFGGDPAIIGQVVRLDGESTTIVGVMPASFASIMLWGPGDIFRPLALNAEEKINQNFHELGVIARYHSVPSLEQLNTRLGTLATRLAPLRAEANRQDGLHAVSLQSLVQNRNTFTLSAMMLGLAGFVLLIACANLANLLLARAIARTHEFAVRAALGASRSRLLRPLLGESVILALGGGLLGVLVTSWANDWMSARLSENGYVKFTIGMDWRVFAFAMLVSLATGVIFGLVPAWLMSRVNVNATLKSGSRTAKGDRAQNRFRHTLIVAQFALALILLAGAGFFMRGVDRMLKARVGWDTDKLAMTVINLPPAKYATPTQTYLFYTRLQQRLAALPGVENATVGWTLPLFQYLTNRNFVVEGRDAPPAGHEPQAGVNAVMPGYLDTIGVKLLAGRKFADTDTVSSPPVAIINETMAQSLFPGENPIGKRLGNPDPTQRAWMEIVGVISDHSFAVSFNAPPTRAVVLKPLAQEIWNYVTIAVRSSSPEAASSDLRKVIEDMDSDLPLQQFGSVKQVVAKFTSSTAMLGTLLVAFAGLGLFLAALGLYGVIANLVVQRTPEIGVRVALGAQSGDVLWLILHSGIRLTVIGSAIGLVGAYGVSQILKMAAPALAMSSTEASRYDVPVVLLSVLCLLLLVAFIACWLPARRATKVDPMVALRAE